MNWITQLRNRKALCDDVSEEIRAHLEEKTDELIEDGMSPQEAFFAARREFGNAAVVEEHSRETWHWNALEDLLADVRYGLRSLRKNLGFTTVAIFTLALGIGANSAIFSLVNAVLLRPLPFANPDRLVSLSQQNYFPEGGLVAMRTNLQTMDVAGYLDGTEFNLTRQGESERLYGTTVSSEFFGLLGVHPEIGRVFQFGEDQPGKDAEVVLSDRLWKRKFGADPNVIGRRVMLSGVNREVVGVMAPEFDFPSAKSDVWVPMNLDPRAVGPYWGGPWIPIIGRLRDGVSIAKARTDVGMFLPRLTTMFPWKMAEDTWRTPDVAPLQQVIVGDVQSKLLILLGAIALVLLIACANVANLLLARAAARQREIAVRATLGAGRWRICRQLLTESTLLGIMGAALGLAFAYFGIRWLIAILPADEMPRLGSVSIDLRVLLMTLAIGVLTGLVFGLAPALQLSKVGLTESLKTGSKNAVGSNQGLRSLLAIAEISLAVVLVTAAGLMVRSLWELAHVNPGFQTESILSARITPNESFCEDFARCQSFYTSLVEQLRGVPGVRDVALVNALPLNGRVAYVSADFEGHPHLPRDASPIIFDSIISPEYLRVMQIPLLQGRPFTEADMSANAEPVALITASTAKKFWPGEDPIGKHIRPNWEQQWRRVVGVVADVHEASLASPLPFWMHGAMYEPYSRHAVLISRRPATEMTVVIRGQSDGLSFGNALREVVGRLNPDAPVSEVQTLNTVLKKSVSTPRSTMSLFAVFALLAVVLGAVGVYGVVSYSVAQRTSELGLRMALGAQRFDIQLMVLSQGARIAMVGIAAGLTGAFLLTRLMAKLLYNVKTTDPITFVSVAFLLAVIALGACYIPARRAMSLDPLAALRYE